MSTNLIFLLKDHYVAYFTCYITSGDCLYFKYVLSYPHICYVLLDCEFSKLMEMSCSLQLFSEAK